MELFILTIMQEKICFSWYLFYFSLFLLIFFELSHVFFVLYMQMESFFLK
ncbi:hypothetical protein ACJIZ3_014692 [Penstemon smallii]|uniref:ATP synthase F0 subunit 8 n=1 Tax=Penstemon smallii TaxID=265156 RepID=A0ABD3RKE4_9LAMI